MVRWKQIMKEFYKWQKIRYDRGYGTYNWDYEEAIFLRKIKQLVNKEVKILLEATNGTKTTTT